MIQMTEIQFTFVFFLIAFWSFIIGFAIGEGHGESNNK